MKTPLSIIIPVSSLVPESVKYRLETLKRAIKDYYQGVEVIVVEQTLDGKWWFLPYLTGVRKIEIKNEVFNKGWCCNIGVKAASNNYIVIADCDMYSRDIMWDRLYNWMVETKHKWAFAWSRLIYTNPKQREMILSGRDMPGISHTVPTKGYSEGGMVCMKKSFFYEIGQMNELMVNLGGMDNEIVRRCMAATEFMYPIHQALVYHLFHPQRQKHSWRCQGKRSRKENIKILKRVQAHPVEAIEWLCSQEQGNPSSPLFDRKEFME